MKMKKNENLGNKLRRKSEMFRLKCSERKGQKQQANMENQRQKS